MFPDLPQNDSGLFDCFTTISTPFKSNNEMAANTVGYLYHEDVWQDIEFDFVANPFLSTLSKINGILSLNENWDGYNAVPVFPKAGKNAQAFITSLDANSVEKITDIFPNTHGTITFEWESGNDKKIVLEVGSNSYSYFVRNINKPPILVDGKNIVLDYRKIATQVDDVFRENNA